MREWTTALCRDQPLTTLQVGLEAGLALERAADSKHIGVAVLLDCSKCYEHVGQDLALRLTINYARPPPIASLAFAAYRQERRLRVDGAVGDSTQAVSGLVAGCGFAKDFLRARLLQRRQLQLNAQIRDYVGDVVVLRVMSGASAIPEFQADLRRLRAWYQDAGLKLSPAKEQILIFSKQHQRTWCSFEPEAAEILTTQAKDLG